MGRKINAIWTALLGVVIGLLLASIAFKIFGGGKKFDGDYNRWRKLNVILEEVEKNYVDTIDKKSITDAAVEAALARLDPHSVYLPPVELQESETSLAGNFEGIGIQFNVPNDTAIVLNVIPGGPSEKAGLQPGDRIVRVGGRDIAGKNTPQDSMVMMMKGPSGTKVGITVIRQSETIPFEITRDKIPVGSIDASFMVDDTTGYVRLSKFSRNTYTEFVAAYKPLLNCGMTRIIMDLRDNNGGYLEQALLLGNEFLHKGDMIVYMEGLHRARQEYRADGRGKLQNIGLCVLIGESSASSSEIFAGAIQDNDRGIIVGRRSYGKGLVQEPINFTDGSGIRLTVARFYTPSGRCIQKPYSPDYSYDIYERYRHGEMTNADSIKIDRSVEYNTAGGRKVYGGGGIVPDIFVPVDMTKATTFYLNCNKKAEAMRFASRMFDLHRESLGKIDDFAVLEKYLDSLDLGTRFLEFAAADGLVPKHGEWVESAPYMMPQIRALVGRYSRLNENAFYRIYLDIDETFKAAMAADFKVKCD